MTDKQIIIDGVDVSGCGYIDHDSAWCDLCMTNCAKETKPCYYKQLKRAEKTMKEIWDRLGKTSDELLRKEQECEELREQLAEMILQSALLPKFFGLTADEITNMLNQLDQLKAENDELKKTVDDLLHKPEIQDKIIWKIDNEALLGSKDAYIYKLEKTLIEIKDIAEKEVNNRMLFADKESFCDFNKILQKISECEVE